APRVLPADPALARDGLAVDRGEARADDRHEGWRGRARDCRDRLPEGLGLVGLDVDEEEGGRLAAPLQIELARQTALEERDRGEEGYADAERHGDPDRLVPGPGECAQPLTPGEGARPREAPRQPPRRPPRKAEQPERTGGGAEEDRTGPEVAGLPEREDGEPRGHDGRGRPGAPRPHVSRVDRVPQQNRRRHRPRG